MVRLLAARARTQELGTCSNPSRPTGRKGSAMARRGAGAPATRCRAAQGTGRPCRIAALLLFAVATAALPVQAQAPAHCTSEPREIWCATLTVEEDDGDYGFGNGAFGSLDPDYFSYNGNFPDVYSLYYSPGESPPVLIFETDADLGDGDGFEVILGSVRLSLDDTFDEGKGFFAVENPGLSWSAGATVAVRLLAPAPNTAPTALNGSVVMDEDTEYAFQESDFNFSDMDTDDTLASVKVQTLPASGKGTLKFDGVEIAMADLPKTVTKAELDANKLVYSPPADAFGSTFGSFTFKVNDGTDDSASAYTMTIDVNEVSDRPVVANFIPDQSAMVGTAFSFQFADDVFKNGKVGPLTYSSRQFDGTALPSWLSFAPGTRTLSGMPQSSDVGTVPVTVTARNDVGLSTSDTFDLVVSSRPAISGTARVGQTLTARTGSNDSFTYQWIRVDGMTEANISGATSSTHILGAADSGKKVKVKVSFTANSVTTEATSDAYPPHARIQPASSGTANLAGRRQVWEGTLTVGAHVAGLRTDPVAYGWSRHTGELTGLDDAIDLGANSYRIGSFVLRYAQYGEVVDLLAPPPGSLVFSLIGADDRRDSNEATQELVAAEKTALRLHVGGRTFDFSSATVLQWGNYEWQDADLIWAEGDSIPLKLSVPTSFMQVAVDPPTVDDTPRVSGAGNDGAWTEGESVDVAVTFSEAVDVDKAGGTPSIGIGLGGTASRSAAYVSGSGTTELVFRYTLVEGDGSHTVMAVTPDSLALGGGTIRSVAAGLDAELAHNGTVVQGSSTRNVRSSAEFHNVPTSHDKTAFKVGLRFSAAPAGLNAKRDAASVLEVTGGSVTGARESSKGANPDWEVTVAPDGVGDVAVRVPVRACSEANAVCIGGQALSEAAEAVVPGPPFTASFTQAPSAHDGASGFDLHLKFSHEPAEGFSYRTVEDALFDIEGGAITRVWRRERGKNRLWGITITPDGDDAVTLAARATTDCAAPHAVCDAEGRKFTGGLTATIPGPEVSEPPDPITASWSSKPDEHDGSSPFDLHLDFSRKPVDEFSYRAIAGGVVNVEGGQISRVWRRERGENDQWGVEVTPSGTDGVTVSVNGTTDCAAQHAVCAADGGMLEGGAQAVIPGPPPDPITASWSSKPDEHDGSSPFDLHLDFSRKPVDEFSYRAIAGGVVNVEGGQISRVWRRERGENDQWGVEVTPSGTDGVTVSVNGTTDCAAQHAVCAADGGMLEGGAPAVIPGPAMLSVADARVEEDQGATLDFVVSLSRSRNEATTVEYATSDGTARADEDYTAASGTLTFAANETSRTVLVTVLDDVHDEGEETLTLRLSNASGSQVADGEATGTIANRDPLPRALLARFGRTAAVHVVEHIEERLAAPRAPGFRGRFAGRELRRGMERDVALNFVSQLGGMAGVSPLGRGVAGSPGAGVDGIGSVGTPGFAGGAAMGAAAPPGAMAGTMGGTGLGASGVGAVASPMGAAGPAGGFFNRGGLLRSLGGGDLLTGSDFALNRGTRGGILSFWSRGARSYFAGREGTLGLNGDVRTTMFGADYARGPMVAGLSLSHSRGLGEYAGAASGQVLSSVTGLYPWLGYQATDRITVWGVGGYGGGGLLLTPQGGPGLESGLSMKMAAAGTRGELVAGGASGFALAFKADALWVGTSIDGVDGPAGRLAATDAAVTRLRTGLEGSRAYAVAGRLSLTPSVEAGLRHDGGDAETGAGMDVGAGLVVSDSSTGLSLDVRVRTLLVHQAEGFRERGVALSFSYNPTPSSPLGFTASVAPSWGGEARSGAEALWGRETMAGVAHGSFAQGNRLAGEVGYGLSVGSRFVGTPRVGFSASEYGRDYRVGYRLGVLDQGNTKFELGVDAQRQENAMRGGTSNGFLGRATLGW